MCKHIMGPSLIHNHKTYLYMGVQAVQGLQNGCGGPLWVLGGVWVLNNFMGCWRNARGV